MRPLTRSCFLLLLLGRLLLLALPVLLRIFLRSRWRPSFPLHALALIPLFLAKVRFSPTLTHSPLMIWCLGLTALFLFPLAESRILPAEPVDIRPRTPRWWGQREKISNGQMEVPGGGRGRRFTGFSKSHLYLNCYYIKNIFSIIMKLVHNKQCSSAFCGG